MFKKLSALLLAFVMLFSLAGCGNNVLTMGEKRQVNIMINSAQKFLDGKSTAKDAWHTLYDADTKFKDLLMEDMTKNAEKFKNFDSSDEKHKKFTIILEDTQTLSYRLNDALWIEEDKANGETSNSENKTVDPDEIQQIIDRLRDAVK